jgi:hypothetical protein
MSIISTETRLVHVCSRMLGTMCNMVRICIRLAREHSELHFHFQLEIGWHIISIDLDMPVTSLTSICERFPADPQSAIYYNQQMFIH